MAKKKIVKSVKKVAKKVVKKKEEVTKDEIKEVKPKIEPTKKKEVKKDYGMLAGYTILDIKDTVINGKEYKSITLSNNSVTLLSEKDLAKQINK